LTVEVPSGKFQCFFHSVDNPNHKTMEIDYQVIDGGDLDINFMLILGAEVLVQDARQASATHKVELKSLGEYQLCFDNSFSYQARKVVFFEIFMLDAQGNIDASQDPAQMVARTDDLDLRRRMEAVGITIAEFHNSADRIRNTLNRIEYNQAVLRAYEARDKAVMTTNFDRVSFWSLINSIVLIGVGAVQVYMIRCLFEENSKVGRLLRRSNHNDRY